MVIFATVGTHPTPFDRMVRAVDALAAATDEEVIAQIGAARYEPVHATWFRMATNDEMILHMSKARLVITHAADTILEAVRQGKPVVAVPRYKSLSEHIDDHQVELAAALRGRPGLAFVGYGDDLAGAVRDLGQLPQLPDVQPPTRLIDSLRRAIGETTST